MEWHRVGAFFGGKSLKSLSFFGLEVLICPDFSFPLYLFLNYNGDLSWSSQY